ncbi:hypothetical protein [Herbaspirillum seropedicae]|uniref:nSTAND3 domain-containing NTPase n=1 Tax=Herbaspirillum seropedicae TaxID=964 RepID=UPI000848275D|nr:hypothetical protein [Herbaspirillum seropedicae]
MTTRPIAEENEKRSLRGAAAAQAGYDYQLDVSILAALQLLLISNATTRITLEPANEEDLEADMNPHVPGRMQPSATVSGGHKLVVQVKMDNGEPWSIDDLVALLKHGSDKAGGRRPALHHLDEPNTRYLLVTNADAKGVLRNLLVEGFEEPSDKDSFPASLRDTLEKSPEGRIAIWGKLTSNQLASNIKEMMSDLLHVPKVNHQSLLERLRAEAKRRAMGSKAGVWIRDDLLTTIQEYGGFLASSASLEQYVKPENFEEILGVLLEKNAVVIRGPSGTGKTQTAYKLCEIARHRNGHLEQVTIGAEDTPTSIRKASGNGPTLFNIDDPWGQFSLSGGSEAWTEQLPRLLSRASPDQQFVITTRSDMMQIANVGESFASWCVELNPEQYKDGQLGEIYDMRMNRLPPLLRTTSFKHRTQVLEKLETPLEIEFYFAHMQNGPRDGEKDHDFAKRLMEMAQRDAIESVVVRALSSIDTCGTSAIIWALLKARRQLDRSRLHALQRSLRAHDRSLGEGVDRLVDRMIAARYLRQPVRTITFAHPSVRQGFEGFIKSHWEQSRFAIESLIASLIGLSSTDRAWYMETAARVFEEVRAFSRRSVKQDFIIDPECQRKIDVWIDESLIDPQFDFEPLLELASEIGSEMSISSRVARWLLKANQRGGEVFDEKWKPAEFDAAWYEVVSKDPISAQIAARFIREMLCFDHGNYGLDFASRLERIAPNLTGAYLDAASTMIGFGFVNNADLIAQEAVRDLEACASVLEAALDDVEDVAQKYDQHWREKWQAIDDGERDYAESDAFESSYIDDGYASGIFIKAYVREAHNRGNWLKIATHPRAPELVQDWSNSLIAFNGIASEDELKGLMKVGIATKNESSIWGAVCKHWRTTFGPILAERLLSSDGNSILLDELVLTALKVAPNALATSFKMHLARPDLILTLLAAIQRSHAYLSSSDEIKLEQLLSLLPPLARHIFEAFPQNDSEAGIVDGPALLLLETGMPGVGAEVLKLVVPVIIASSGNSAAAIKHWLLVADSKDDAILATRAAISIGDRGLVEVALKHRRADARKEALIHLASMLSDPLPCEILAMASDPGSRVRRALVEILKERPHLGHIDSLLNLIHDTWSGADPHFSEVVSFDIASEAVVALAAYEHLSDQIGVTLLELASKTKDRSLRQVALLVAAIRCSTLIQLKIMDIAETIPISYFNLDALDALSNCQALSPSVATRVTSKFMMKKAPIFAVSAAHFVGTHAAPTVAVQIFEEVANLNQRRALLLVGANALATRDRVSADRVLNLLGPCHPGGKLLMTDTGTIPMSLLADLGDVRLLNAVMKKLPDRISPG